MADAHEDPVFVPAGVDLLMIDDDVVLYNADDRKMHEVPVSRAGAVASTLARLRAPTDLAYATSLVSDATGCSAADAAAEVHALSRAGLLVQDEPDPTFVPSPWAAFGWDDAFRYHRHLRLLPMIDWSSPESVAFDRRLMQEYLALGEPPPLSTDRTDRVAREAWFHGDAAAVKELQQYADTQTDPADLELDRRSLELVLQGTFGRTGTRRLPVTGAHITKTSPSGGSRHPIEAYVLIADGLDGVVPGTLHYNVGRSRLDRLDDRDPTAVIRDDLVILRGRPSFRPVAACVLVATCERSMFRYRESRSYRVLLHDAGHLLQTMTYIASSLERPSYRGYTLREKAVCDYLRVEPLLHLPLAFAVIG